LAIEVLESRGTGVAEREASGSVIVIAYGVPDLVGSESMKNGSGFWQPVEEWTRASRPAFRCPP
jgi:hypothetical protein